MKFILTALITLFIATGSQAQAFQWAKRIGYTGSDKGTSMAIDNSGNIYSVGSFSGTVDFDPGPGIFNMSSANGSLFIQKMDNAGNFISAIQMGSGIASQIKLDVAGNIYITGYFSGSGDFDPGIGVYNLTSAGSTDIFILKLDNSGNFIWADNMGGTSSDYSMSLVVDATGNVYTTGYFVGTADFDPGLGIYNLTSNGASYYDIFISKLDANGIFQWAKRAGSTTDDKGFSIALDNSGNVYITGFFRSTVDFDPGPATYNLTSSGVEDIFILQLDAGGNFLSAKKMGGTGSDEAKSMTIDIAGNIYITGNFNSTADFDPGIGVYNLTSAGADDIFVAKLDVAGNFVWAKRMGGINYDNANSIFVDNSGNVFTLGDFYGVVDFDPGGGVYNIGVALYSSLYLSKLDNAGNFLWAKTIGGLNTSTGVSVLGDNSGNIYSIGYFTVTSDFDPGAGVFNLTSAGSYDIFIHKYSYCGTNHNVTYNSCDSISLFGTSYTLSGDYVQQFSDINGCDSNLNLHIQLHPTIFNYPITTVCDSIAFGGNMITATGTYNHLFTSIWGCDSTVFLNVTVKHSTETTITQTACNSYTLNGQTYTSSGVYTQTLNNAVGCDSIITLNLTINYSSGTTLTATSCGPYTLNGQTYNASGVYTQTYVNAVGCDSVVTINLTVNQPTAFTVNQAACISYTLNGQTYNTSGIYTQTLVNAAGCDSIITLNLTINQPTANTINQTACTSFTLNGQTYNTSGTYTQTLVNAVNCDRVITLNLTINQPTANTIAQTACNSYTLNGQTYNASGVYTQTLVNAANCDSVLTLNLTINTVNTAVTQSGALLTAGAAAASYQWLSCNPYQVLAGEISQAYTAPVNGEYAVAVTENGCTDTSVCYTVTGIGINNYLQSSNITLYPIPVTQKLFIASETAFQHAAVKIFSIAGKTVIEKNNISGQQFEIDMSKLVAGTYFVEILDGGYKYVRVINKE